MEKNNEQELNLKFQMFEQQIRHIQQQQQAVEQGLFELSHLNIGLDDFIGAKDKEIMAPIGKGIFAKVKLLSEDLIVDIGGGNFIKKNISQTKDIIKGQIAKLDEARKSLDAAMQQINGGLTATMQTKN